MIKHKVAPSRAPNPAPVPSQSTHVNPGDFSREAEDTLDDLQNHARSNADMQYIDNTFVIAMFIGIDVLILLASII
jgi:hypothetical protein